MSRLVTGLFLFAALVNALPVVGVLSAARLEALYGVPIEGPDLELLMRHRASLFAAVAALLAVAAFHPPLRVVAGAVGLFSMLGFVALAAAVDGELNAALRRVALVDVVASAALLAALVLDARR